MTEIPPWRALKPKSSDTLMSENCEICNEWRLPEVIALEKHVRFYKDLLRSTERVELTLSHSGKKEVTEGTSDPSEPSRSSREASSRHEVIMIPVRTENDPRASLVQKDGSVKTRPEYRDELYLRELVLRRGRIITPVSSRNPSPIGSPKHSGTSTPLNSFGSKPSPPAGGPGKPPPPPKAPPPEKRPRMSVG